MTMYSKKMPANMSATKIARTTFSVAVLASTLVGVFAFMQAQANSKTNRPANVPAELADNCWVESFSDDFNKLDLWDAQTNSGQWKTSYIWPRDAIINEELQYYVDEKEHGVSPFSINNGVLNITASKTPSSLKNQVNGAQYISGVLTTENGFSQKYGRFDALAQVPAGRGLWSAFWLLPSFDQWPQGVAILPEIDVMEHIGHEVNTFHTTLHTNQNGPLESHPYDHTFKYNITEDFHLYTVVWTPEYVNWYFDKRWVASHRTPKDFTRPVHFLLNLAVGGTWPGAPDANTTFPANYRIDYVKAFTDSDRC